MKQWVKAVAVGTAALGLAGCNFGAGEDVASGPLDAVPSGVPTAPPITVGSTPATSEQAPIAGATVTFQARFPQTEAQAALIDPSTANIGIKVIETSATTLDEFIATNGGCLYPTPYTRTCPEFLDWIDGLGAASAVLSPANPTATVNLIPNRRYAVVALQYDSDLSLAWNTFMASSTSFINVTEGAHQVAMYLLHGTWQFVDANAAAAPVTLRLLNNTALLDTIDGDPLTTGVQVVDWDITTPGTQTPADVLGFGQGTLNGINLLGRAFNAANFGNPGGWVNAPAPGVGGQYAPQWLVADGQGGSTAIPYEASWSYWDDVTGLETWVDNSPAQLFQTYDPVAGNATELSLGSWGVERWDSNTENGYYAGLMFLDKNFNMGTPVNDGTNWVYTYTNNQGGSSSPSVSTWNYTDQMGALMTLYYTNLDYYDSNVDSHPNTDAPITSYAQTALVNGTTITGTLVEHVDTWRGSRTYGPAPLPSPVIGNSPTAVAAAGDTRAARDRTIARAVQLELMAQQAGLKASAAGIYGANCTTMTNSGDYAWSQFGWNKVTGQWEPGSPNWSYWVDMNNPVYDGNSVFMFYPAYGADLDGDGTPEPFEAAFYNNSIQYVGSDGLGNPLGTASMICPGDVSCYLDTTVAGQYTGGQDLDGDGLIEEYEAVPTLHSNQNTTEVCMHPFTLKGQPLVMPTVSTGVVIAGE